MILNKSPNDYLFKTYEGKCFNDACEVTTIFSNALEKQYEKSTSSTISIAKYAILQMIEAGIDRDTIQDFTKYGDSIYIPCKELAYLVNIDEKREYLANTLKSINTFDIL